MCLQFTFNCMYLYALEGLETLTLTLTLHGVIMQLGQYFVAGYVKLISASEDFNFIYIVLLFGYTILSSTFLWCLTIMKDWRYQRKIKMIGMQLKEAELFDPDYPLVSYPDYPRERGSLAFNGRFLVFCKGRDCIDT